jgi:hypothetical protein
MKIYRFMDLFTGGFAKTDFVYVYVEANNDIEAYTIFNSELSVVPSFNNYGVEVYDNLESASAFERGCSWDENKNEYIQDGIPVDEFLYLRDVLFISHKDN